MKNQKNNNFSWGGLHPFSHHPIVFNLIPNLNNKRIVDCGCGKGIWGYLMRCVRDTSGSELIGMDVNKKYLDFCRAHNVYDKLIQRDVSSLPFKDRSVDFLICSEVIEHLDKNGSSKFIKEVDRVMKKGGKAIITTPNLEMETKIIDGPDAHHSLWGVDMFRKRGFKVFGTGVRISPGVGRWYTSIILAIHHIFTPISYLFPEIGAFLIAVKNY